MLSRSSRRTAAQQALDDLARGAAETKGDPLVSAASEIVAIMCMAHYRTNRYEFRGSSAIVALTERSHQFDRP